MSMDRRSALAGLARVSGLLVSEHDPLDVVTAGLDLARCQVSADAAGVLVAGETLEVLAATSHRATDLEIYQAGSEQGPCVDSIRGGTVVVVGSPEEGEARWPGFGTRMGAAGYARAVAVPMVWRDRGIGGLNFFWTEPGTLAEEEVVMLQTFADVLTIAVVHVRPIELVEALDRVQDALAARSGIEQAKGVLSWQRDVDMEAAYAALLDIARDRGVGVREAARVVVEQAARGQAL